jgi:hypothetical protein
MRKIIQMSLEEFSSLKDKEQDWNNLKIGEIYVDLLNGKWKAVEVIDLNQRYGGLEPVLEEFDLQIV